MNNGIVAAVMCAGAWKGEVPAGMSPWRALLPLNGRPMLSYVMDAIAASTLVTETVMVAPPEFAELYPHIQRLEPTEQLTTNVVAGARYALGRGRVLLIGSDIPLLTPASIDSFIQDCSAADVQFFYSIIEKAIVMAKYPQMKRTFLKLSDGTYTGGNLMLSDPQFLLDSLPHIQAIVNARKNVPGLCRYLGLELLVRVALTRLGLPLLDVARAEALVSRAVHGYAIGVPSTHPEIGADLDSLDEVPVYEAILSGQGTAKDPANG